MVAAIIVAMAAKRYNDDLDEREEADRKRFAKERDERENASKKDVDTLLCDRINSRASH